MDATTPSEAGVVRRPTSVRSLGVPWRWGMVSAALLLIALVVGVAVGPAGLSLGGIYLRRERGFSALLLEGL